MNSVQLLIVFIRNLQKGKVKTRLAKTMGADMAFEIYKELLVHTFEMAKNCPFNKKVYYSDHIEVGDIWQQAGFEQEVQSGDDLGAKMYNAFASAFDNSYKEVILIGSDCMELDTEQIMEAFRLLQKSPAVIGPATDGGFYMFGLKNIQQGFFLNKTWGHNNVFKEMENDLKKQDLVPYLLPVLADIDIEEDWINHQR